MGQPRASHLLALALCGACPKPAAVSERPTAAPRAEATDAEPDASDSLDNAVWRLLPDGPASRNDATVEALMESFNEAIGEDCEFCHEGDDHEAPTRQIRITNWMAHHLVGLLERDSGEPATCISCHAGQADPMPTSADSNPELRGALIADIASDKRAIKKRMNRIAKALGVQCDYCHDLQDFTKPTHHQQVANYMHETFVDGHTRADGSELWCDSCHKGSTHVLPD